ncbi:MAG TPA: hypothetical protein VGW34_06115 [Allosphingosinicella sp.]|nr:hypothetical protein [Allosphingosinicella sp.]
MRKKLAMTGWYNPVMLVQTATRVAISTVLGQAADRREAMAAANAVEPQPFDVSFDYSARGTADFWLDFIADTGDGWNSTFAMARLLARDSLVPDGASEPLQRGSILVLGGDQVYPTASRTDYDDRLIGPFEEAYHPEGGTPQWDAGQRPDLYAIPGNHDWYDSLNAFFGLFCRRRIQPKGGIGSDRDGKVIGGRQTRQTRSYFAIRLPGNWWLWGTDSQLEGYIDQPQIEYFEHVASHWMAAGSNLILCVGQPSWEYVDPKESKKAFANFSYLERLAGAATDLDGKPLGHRLKLVLTGDSHHYARYTEGDRHYITCGGGGAFLHPTHHLEDAKRFEYEYPEPGTPYVRGAPPSWRNFAKQAIYPGWRESWLLTFWNFAFPIKNWKFPLALLPAYFLFTWLLHFNAKVSGRGSLAAELMRGSLADAVAAYWRLAVESPWPVILALVALGGYRYFADVANSWGRTLVGGLHALAQAAAVTVATCWVIRGTAGWWDGGWGSFASLVAASAASALVSASVFGTYLWVALGLFKRHWNEAFSSFAHRGYKSFLRLRIRPNGELCLYPIGLTNVPWDRGRKSRNPPLQPHLIEAAIAIPPPPTVQEAGR